MEEILYLCVGINYMVWFLKFEWNGKDVYFFIREKVNDFEIYI